MNTIYIIDGPFKGKTFALKSAITTLGRAVDNNIRITDTEVAPHHAVILKKDNRIFISDRNGLQEILIDGRKLESGHEVELVKKNTIMIGNTTLSFQKKRSRQREPKKISRLNESRSEKDYTRNYVRSLELLLKVLNVFAQSLNIRELFSAMIDQIFCLLKRIDRGAIVLLDKETGALKEMASRTRLGDREGPFSTSNYSGSIVRKAIETGEPVMISDKKSIESGDLFDSRGHVNIASVICVPLTYKGEVRGAIYVDSLGSSEGFRKDDLQFLTGLSNNDAVAIQNAQL